MKRRIAGILSIVMLLAVVFTGCSRQVTVDSTDLKNITLSGAATCTTGEDYIATLIPNTNHVLPQHVTVTVGRKVLLDGYTYDNTTGTLTISGDVITDNVSVFAEASESIMGRWQGSIDIADLLNEYMNLVPGMEGYFSFTDISFGVVMNFSTNTCSLTISENSVDTAMTTLKEQMKPGLIEMLEDMLVAEGLDMTVDEALDMMGMTMDMLIDQYFDEATLGDLAGGLATEGQYAVKDGMLYISGDLETTAEEAEGNPYALADGVLTIQAGKADEAVAFMFPLVLERIQ